jgi:hypothetical protein
MRFQKLIWGLVLTGAVLFAGGCNLEGVTPPPRPAQIDPGSNDGPPVPPQAPIGVGVPKVTAQGFKLLWLPNAEENIAGYRVYFFDPNPERSQAYTLVNTEALIPASEFVYTGSTLETIWVCVTAMDANGLESDYSPPIEVNGRLGGTPSEVDPGNDRDGRNPWDVPVGSGREEGNQYSGN